MLNVFLLPACLSIRSAGRPESSLSLCFGYPQSGFRVLLSASSFFGRPRINGFLSDMIRKKTLEKKKKKKKKKKEKMNEEEAQPATVNVSYPAVFRVLLRPKQRYYGQFSCSFPAK
ncbi:hypothetical protein B9Z55_006802 [Caenorhabditis nigoni]|uniref:Uncharacterized protein n=1 Tax=Caenorhabditis nigoni TaxID=1611254 RepID=A0A2G5V6S7_9PELO|nr:hypothetical protein B9Z55_006802 [Caenorhabditis nigoni]